jgi:hypothetical protein
VKQAFWFLCAIIVSTFASGALVSAEAQISTPTPDSFAVQLTNTPNISFANLDGDMSADGRFVVFVSNGNHATQNPKNADGNREIFLADYAQRRIFQITNTKNVANPTPSPSPTPTPSPSPSPSASPTPTPSPVPLPEDLTQVKIHIVNKEPMMTLAPVLVGGPGGQRSYTIVFSSNAPNPGNFDGTDSAALSADANTEIWIYRVPAVSDVDLTLGTDLPLQDLAAGTFVQITNTPTSRAPTAGSPTQTAFFSDDNREPTITEDGRIIAFASTRNLVTAAPGNADLNPEIFFYDLPNTTFIQGTNTTTTNVANAIFQGNPTLSADGSRVSFFSNANIATTSPNNADNNGEIYVGTFSGSAMTSIRQVTRTQHPVFNVNVLSPGRRLSRNGAFIAFESLATDPKANTATIGIGLGLFVCNIDADTFVEVAARPTTIQDIGRNPIFTDYNPATLAPSSLVFASRFNLKPDGTVPAEAQAAEGMNPQISPQLFLTQVPASTTNTYIRITNTPQVGLLTFPRPMASASRTRMAYNLGGVDLGGGNPDGSIEIFYHLSPIVTAVDTATLTFNTGASNMPVATATPVPSPSPSPTPTPSPSPGVALGLAPGQLSIVRSTVALATTTTTSTGGAEQSLCVEDPTKFCRSPALPVELNGVSLAVNSHAAGLYFVGNAEKQINFVMPVSAAPGLGTVAVNILNAGANTDTILRGFTQIVVAQPDIFTSTMDALGDAVAVNVTNPNLRLPPPFNVTSTDSSGNTVPTVVELSLTGTRLAARTEITVTIGTTSLSGEAVVLAKSNPAMPGWDIINFTLPASLAGAGEVPIVVTFTRIGSVTTNSRPADTAPKIRIN